MQNKPTAHTPEFRENAGHTTFRLRKSLLHPGKLGAATQWHQALVDALRDILAAYHGLTLGRQDTEWEGRLKVAARQASRTRQE